MNNPPMAPAPLLMPKLGLTMTEGTVAKWIASDGSRFSAGDVLLLVETDKVTFDVEAPSDGELVRALASEGEVVPVGAVIAEWMPSSPAAKSTPGISPTKAISQGFEKRVIATPLARRIARQRGIDLATVVPTGPGGRIKAADVGRVAPPGKELPRADTTIETAPVSQGADRIRHLIADRMVEAKREIPHFYLSADIEVNRLLEVRDEINAAKPAQRVTLTHFIIAAVRQALCEVPQMNAVWAADGPRPLDGVDVGLAVMTDRGLMNPVIHDIGEDDFSRIVRKTADVIDRARSGRLRLGDTEGGALTVSNVGSRNIRYMTSIVVPGQSAILGIGSVQSWFRPDDAGAPIFKRELGIVLSADHRLHDGVTAADFLEYLRSALSRPINLVAGVARRNNGAAAT